MNKQAWYIYNTSCYDEQRKIELTGRCKKTSGGPDYTYDRHRVEIQKYLFGFKCGTEWVLKERVRIFDAISEEIYECDCFKDV
jgi:hypothetical protein